MHPYLTLENSLPAAFRTNTTYQPIVPAEHVGNPLVENKQIENEILNFLGSNYREKHIRREQLEGAIRTLEMQDPNHLLIPLARGELCRISNNFEEMCTHFAKLDVESDIPEEILAFALSRKALYFMHRYPEERGAFISLIEKAYAAHSEDPLIVCLYGRAVIKSDAVRAVQLLQTAYQRERHDPFIVFSYADLFFMQNGPVAANLKKGIKIARNIHVPYFPEMIAQMSAKWGEEQERLAYFKKRNIISPPVQIQKTLDPVDACLDAVLAFLFLPYETKVRKISEIYKSLSMIEKNHPKHPHPPHPLVLLCLGDIAYLKQDEVQAINHFQKLLPYLPHYLLTGYSGREYPFVFSRSGLCFFSKNLHVAANDALAEAIEDDSSDPITVCTLADVYQYMNACTGKKVDTSSIGRDLQSLYEKFPKDPIVVCSYAKYQLQNGTLPENRLLGLLKDALSLHQDNIGITFLLGEFFFKRDKKIALDYYQRAISSPMALKNRYGQMALVRRAEILADSNPTQAARDLLTVSIHSRFHDVLHEAIDLLLKSAQNQFSVDTVSKIFKRIHKANPNDTQVFWKRGRQLLEHRNGDRAFAIRDMWKAMQFSVPKQVNKEKVVWLFDRLDTLNPSLKNELLYAFIEQAMQTQNLKVVRDVYTRLSSSRQITAEEKRAFLISAVRYGTPEMVQFFIGLNNGNIPRDPETGGSLLFSAVGVPHCNLGTVRYLLTEVDLVRVVNEKDKMGRTAVDFAEEHNQLVAARILKDAGGIASRPVQALESKQTHYVDRNRLLKGKGGMIDEIHREWFIQQAFLLEYMQYVNIDKTTRERLGLALLNGYSKGAGFARVSAQTIGAQTSPLLQASTPYYFRGPYNPIFPIINNIYAQMLDLEEDEVKIVHSSLFSHVINRVFPKKVAFKPIRTLEDIDQFIECLIQLHEQKGFQLDDVELVDFSMLCRDSQTVKQVISGIRDLIAEKCKRKNSWLPELLSHVQFVACMPFEKNALFLLPYTLKGIVSEKKWSAFSHRISEIMIPSGFCLSFQAAKSAWLAREPVEVILNTLGVPLVEQVMLEMAIPTVRLDLHDFLGKRVVQAFRGLASDKPYVRLLSRPTYCLLEGLKKHDIDSEYQKRNIGDLIQISYSRMEQAMTEAIDSRDHFVSFMNQLEVIHQEIQTILTIISPYTAADFESAVINHFKEKIAPHFPFKQCRIQANLKTSCMHTISSALAACEVEKGSNQLTVAVQAYTFYEVPLLTQNSKTYAVHVFDGVAYSNAPQNATKEEKIARGFSALPRTPIDLFICEFHHNISIKTERYVAEDLAEHIKAMASCPGLLADKCTIIIDVTISVPTGPENDFDSILQDEVIQKMLHQGRLNLVFIRSAQKFDVLGMDNYCGGISLSLNEPRIYRKFNECMNDERDQERGVTFQGITHLVTHVQDDIDNYRSAIIESAQILYGLLPKKLLYSPNSPYPIQIARRDDPKAPFIDIGSPDGAQLEKLSNALRHAALEAKLPIGDRESFGFAMTNIMQIWVDPGTDDWHKIRFSPGIEGRAALETYAAVFRAFVEEIEDSQEVQDLTEQLSSMHIRPFAKL